MQKIKLTQGKEALVDDIVYPFVANMKWYANNCSGSWYAARDTVLKGVKSRLYLHQFVWCLSHDSSSLNGMEIDHENGNGLDCRKKNLRLASHRQNMINKKICKSNVSGFTGVSARNGKWTVRIGVNGKYLSLGLYKKKEEAIIVRRDAEIKYFGEFSPKMRGGIYAIH